MLCALSVCGGGTVVGGPDECPDIVACAAPEQHTAVSSDPSPAAPRLTQSPSPPVLEVFGRVGAPDGDTTVPLPLTYLGTAGAQDRLLVRVE